MDASTFPRISSAPRPVRSGRAPKEHRRKGGGGIGEPGGGRRFGGAFLANCVPNDDDVMLKISEKIRKIFFDFRRIMLYFCGRISIQPLPKGERDL